MTATIGNELARLIRDGMATRLKVAQFGGLERIADAPAWDVLLPCVIIDPQEANYAEEGGLDIGNLQPVVTETYRIVHFFRYSDQDDIQAKASENVSAILACLAVDAGLSQLWPVIRPNQISFSEVRAVEWHPEDQSFLTDAQQRVKVVALRWMVRWYSRAR
jgi:hypothetical protein